MERRANEITAATTVAAALATRSIAPLTLAQATDIPFSTMRDRLDNKSAFTMEEMWRVGGFLRIHPAELIGASR